MVWVTLADKWNGVADLLQSEPNQRLLAWSSQTVAAWQAFADKYEAPLPPAEPMGRLMPGRLEGDQLLLLEHHLYFNEEDQFFREARASRVWIASSLEDIVMAPFGSDRIKQLMQKMGVVEGEIIEHQMITSSIRRAQEKLEQRRGKEALPQNWKHG